MAKFCLISHALPPAISGQAMVIFRLLRDLNPESYCLISQIDYSPEGHPANYSRRMDGNYHVISALPVDGAVPRGSRFALLRLARRFRIFRFLNLVLNIFSRAKRIARVIKRESCDKMVACTDHFYDLPAGYLASRLTGAQFYVYLFDDYLSKWLDRDALSFARIIGPFLLKRAAGIIVPNEFLRDALRQRFGIETTIIRNACDVSEYEATKAGKSDRDRREFGIAYTGAVYEAQYSALENMVAALQILNRPDVKLHLYTSDPLSTLAGWNSHLSVAFHSHMSVSAMANIQCEADVLFLPLAFNSPYPEVIKTSAPGKMGEYLAARRPILVHAPAGSFVSWYFHEHECGLVVDEDDATALARAVDRLLSDEELCRRISRNAGERARADFSAAIAGARFAELMGVAQKRSA